MSADWTITMYGQFDESEPTLVDGYYDGEGKCLDHLRIPTTIGEALRNYLTKGWVCEVLAVEHKPKHMTQQEWERLTTRSYEVWRDRAEQGELSDDV